MLPRNSKCSMTEHYMMSLADTKRIYSQIYGALNSEAG